MTLPALLVLVASHTAARSASSFLRPELAPSHPIKLPSPCLFSIIQDKLCNPSL